MIEHFGSITSVKEQLDALNLCFSNGVPNGRRNIDNELITQYRSVVNVGLKVEGIKKENKQNNRKGFKVYMGAVDWVGSVRLY